MKTFIIALIALTAGSVYGDFEDYFKHIEDVDAFLIAQDFQPTPLDPPIELYEQIHSDLKAIRAKYPEVAHIHHQPQTERGKVVMVCELYNCDLDKVNASYGPIEVENISLDEKGVTLLVTLGKPYNIDYLIEGGHLDQFKNNDKAMIKRMDQYARFNYIWMSRVVGMNEYSIERGVPCLDPICDRSEKWLFVVNGTNVAIVTKTGTTAMP